MSVVVLEVRSSTERVLVFMRTWSLRCSTRGGCMDGVSMLAFVWRERGEGRDVCLLGSVWLEQACLSSPERVHRRTYIFGHADFRGVRRCAEDARSAAKITGGEKVQNGLTRYGHFALLSPKRKRYCRSWPEFGPAGLVCHGSVF